MTALALIKFDGKTIGIVDTDPQGVGAIAWFHRNVGAYSMDHALQHEGYSLEHVETIDCHDVESLINAICERSGLTMESAFVPFSQSRNAKPGAGDKAWRSLNWRVTIKRHGRVLLKTDYAQGVGHAPAAKMKVSTAFDRNRKIAAERHETETGRTARFLFSNNDKVDSGGGRPIPAPSIGDVMQSLARDSDVLDHAGFEDWARDLGYDVDSRNAERIYRACVDVATKLRAGLGADIMAEIQLAASFN